METVDNTFTDKFINALKNAATELEELRVQVALGKAEAKDIFEDLKKTFSNRMGDLKLKYTEDKSGKDILPVIAAIEHLQLQLAVGIANTKDIFEDQFEKIYKQLKSLEAELKSRNYEHVYSIEMQMEIEKFRAKLELIALHFKLKKIKAETNLQQKKMDFHHKMDQIKIKFLEKESQVKNHWEFFKKEIDEAYAHLKKAFAQ